ncbi:MAG: Uma2 family endonuclease [Verrucomicrobia bacterium]|nr:Uma2 family endonuclease [Verrucomicrobiota bacterium]
MTELVEALVKSPRLPGYVEELQQLLAKENAQRERFYEELTEDIKAEFINGEVIVQSPAKYEHTNAVKLLLTLLHAHVERHQLGFVAAEKVLVCLPRNDYEPDICFFGKLKAAQLQRGQMRFPAPDFIAEVLSESTEARDRGLKFEDYAAKGVGEYWLVDPAKEQVERFLLERGRFEARGQYANGMVRSEIVSGCEIPVRAIFDARLNLTALTSIVSS